MTPQRHPPRVPPEQGSGNAVRVNGLTKSFGATRALNDVDFAVDFGETHALVGENGAGKSTLIRILGGVHHADAGIIEIAGVPCSFSNPRDAILSGIVTIPQELRMVPALSIAENISLGNLPIRRHFGILPGIDRKRMREEARHYLDQLDFKPDLDRPVHSLSFAERQLVAIAKALRLQCRIFILDEPTAALDDHEIDRLFAVIAGMKSRGTAIIYISHRLDEVVAIADRCTVLRDGRKVSTCLRGTFSTADLIQDMTGKMAEEVVAGQLIAGAPLLEEIGGGPDRLTVRKNQTTGLAGLLGSGTDRIVRRLFGLSQDSPQVRLNEDRDIVRLRRPGDAIASSIGFVPGERALGLVMSLSVRDNILLPSIAYDNTLLWINRKAGDAAVSELMELLDIRPRRPDMRVGSLSGGNQQKVIIAKWLARRVSTLLLDEPTHGIDIAAKMHVHGLIRKFSSEGGGVVVSSSDLGELARICDRVLSVRNRQIVGEIDRRDGLDEAKLRASIGGPH